MRSVLSAACALNVAAVHANPLGCCNSVVPVTVSFIGFFLQRQRIFWRYNVLPCAAISKRAQTSAALCIWHEQSRVAAMSSSSEASNEPTNEPTKRHAGAGTWATPQSTAPPPPADAASPTRKEELRTVLSYKQLAWLMEPLESKLGIRTLRSLLNSSLARLEKGLGRCFQSHEREALTSMGVPFERASE